MMMIVPPLSPLGLTKDQETKVPGYPAILPIHHQMPVYCVRLLKTRNFSSSTYDLSRPSLTLRPHLYDIGYYVPMWGRLRTAQLYGFQASLYEKNE